MAAKYDSWNRKICIYQKTRRNDEYNYHKSKIWTQDYHKYSKCSHEDLYRNYSQTSLKSTTLKTTRPLIFITGIFIVMFAPYLILNGYSRNIFAHVYCLFPASHNTSMAAKYDSWNRKICIYQKTRRNDEYNYHKSSWQRIQRESI
jgi:hypothetical protein